MKNALLAILLFFTANSFAQTWVQVPDPNFQAFLTANYPAAAFMTNGSDFFVDADHADIQNEDSLDISNLGIASIDGVLAFNNLIFINCSNNIISTLSDLPLNLVHLDCSYNQLISLPNLPFNLNYLQCSSNQLTVLPDMPSSVSILHCNDNQLSTLPILSDNMVILAIIGNLFTDLPALPTYLYSFSCANNQLTELPGLPNSLISLDCSDNQLSELDLPASLQYLWIMNNQFSVCPNLPAGLTSLQCNNNQLSALSTLPSTLTALICDNNQLTTLPDLPNSLTGLLCAENQINCFPEFPSSLTVVQIFSNPFTCLPNYVPAMDAATLAYPLCNENDPVNNPNACQSAMGIQGSIFEDVNNDCVDSGLPLIYVPMVLNDDNGNLITSSTNLVNGDYYFAAEPGDYELAINTTVLSPALQVTCPVNNANTATVTQAVPVVEGGDFGLVCSGFDLGVQSVVPNGLVFPGQTHELNILAGDLTAQFQAYCATGISGDVSITVSGPGTIAFSGSPSITGNTATYTIVDFGAVGANVFSASILTDTTANSSDEFCVSVTVTTATTGDLNASNNTYSYCYQVVNSYDPNIKETYPELVAPGFTDEFTYTIHFQNTGNAPAINIRLADVLDENLDLTSLKIVDASSDYTFSVDAVSRIMSIRFPNIMLADSASDPEGSIGYVQYRIKPVAGLPNETIIENTCSIYFDYNSPIITNTTQNVFGYLGMNELSDLDIQLYPNPASSQVVLESDEEMESIDFFTLNGVKVNELQPHANKTKVNVSSFENGVYLVKIYTATGVKNTRLVINQ